MHWKIRDFVPTATFISFIRLSFCAFFLYGKSLKTSLQKEEEMKKNMKKMGSRAFCIFLLGAGRIACSSRANPENRATSWHAGWCPLQATLKQSMKKLNSRGQIILLAKGPNTVVKKSACRTFLQKTSNFLVHVVLSDIWVTFRNLPTGGSWLLSPQSQSAFRFGVITVKRANCKRERGQLPQHTASHWCAVHRVRPWWNQENRDRCTSILQSAARFLANLLLLVKNCIRR